MHRKLPRTVSCLALALGAGVLPAQGTESRLPPGRLTKAKLSLVNAQQPLRVSMAMGQILARKDSFGLGAAETLTFDRAFTNNQGETFIRLDHSYQGHRVWGSRGMAKISAQGALLETNTGGIMTGVNLAGNPSLTSTQAAQIAVAQLDAQVKIQGTPVAEQVVFSPRYSREAAVPVIRSVQPKLYAWAYQVHVNGKGPQGSISMTYVIDGDSGAVLRADDQLVYAAPLTPVPARGTGLGFYSGQVSLSTSKMEDGTYALWDTTRGSLPNPQLNYNFLNAGWGAGTAWNPSGLQVWFESKNAAGSDQYTQFLFQKNVLNGDFTDAWGDGKTWGGSWVNEGLANGQSAGVDIHYAMGATWDFYGNVFNRNGIDGKGTSVYAMALQGGPMDTQDYQTDVAFWDGYNFVMSFGAGSYPANPKGLMSLSDFDIVAHEMAHGVTQSTAGFDGYPGLSGNDDESALNEGSADFLAQMAKAYSKIGPFDDPFSIPNTGIDWTMGAGPNRGTPLRWMSKPSKDGLSFDAYYDGLGYIDPHYSGGVLSRALYFLAQGASSNPADDGYSASLPGGMAGVGNDHAARIWWKVLSENLLGHPIGTLMFKDARSAALGAAIDLFGEGSPEAIGVENAFAAVNVGAAHGQAPRTEVAFENWRTNSDWVYYYGFPWFANRQIFPMGETVPLKIAVRNNTNTQVTWSVGGPSMFRGISPNGGTQVGGKINADGTWTIPNVGGKYAITATSVADPSQFAEGRAIAVHFDCDSDGENDAMDMAGIAFGWGLRTYLDLNQAVFPGLGAGDEDVAWMADCIKNAWPTK
jgi:Zn-dependent metalloprotease